MPRRFRSSRVRLMLVTRTTGRCSSAPAAALATTSVTPAARRSGMMMAPAPAACAVRMTAPRLCGSSTPSSTTSISLSATLSRSAYLRAAPRAITPWCAAVLANRSSDERGSNRTGTLPRRARSMISCKRGPPAPCAITMRSIGLPARKASAMGWMPLRRAIGLGLGQNLQAVVEAIGEVRHGDGEGDFHDLFVGEMLEHLLARRRRVGGKRQFARIADGGAVGRVEGLVLPALDGAQFVFGESRLSPAGEVRVDTEGAQICVTGHQVHHHLGTAIHRTRTHQRGVERDEVLERLGAVGHGAQEGIRLPALAFQAGEEFVLRRIDSINRGCHRH